MNAYRVFKDGNKIGIVTAVDKPQAMLKAKEAFGSGITIKLFARNLMPV